MTDRKIIHKFLRNFDVDIRDSNDSANYMILDKMNKQVFEPEEFRVVFHKVFGYYITDKKEQSVEIFIHWFKSKKIKSNLYIIYYLFNYILLLFII